MTRYVWCELSSVILSESRSWSEGSLFQEREGAGLRLSMTGVFCFPKAVALIHTKHKMTGAAPHLVSPSPCLLSVALWRFLRRARDQAHATIVGEVIIGPVRQYDQAIAETDQLNQVD